MLVEKFGKEIVSIKDSRSTNPVFFAAQQGKEKHTEIVSLIGFRGSRLALQIFHDRRGREGDFYVEYWSNNLHSHTSL